MGRIAGRGAVLVLGAVWWWAALRLALGHGAGVEGAVVLAGWGLSVLPVHCVAKREADGALVAGRWRAAWRVGAVADRQG
ncbi:hypothetical protein KUM39_26830 [Streptomyces sp. J2-1]|nr:hypothetical protein [Streptomyces corallincola]